MKITELTQVQKNLMIVKRDEWTNRALGGDTSLHEEWKAQLDWLYTYCGLEKPEIKIKVSSPMGLQLAANYTKALLKECDKGASVLDNVRGIVWKSVEASVLDNVRKSVRKSVHNNVQNNVWNNVRRSVRESVWERVQDNVRDNVRDSVRGSEAEYFNTAYCGNYGDYGWVSFYDYFDAIAPESIPDQFRRYREFLKSGFYDMIQLRGICIVCERPKMVIKNDEGLMHDVEGPCIEWNDGFSLFSINGRILSPENFASVKDKSIKVETTPLRGKLKRVVD